MDEPRNLLEHEEARRSELFVDRADELATLLEAARDPGPRIFYVHGPGGIGKTSLLQVAEVALRARASTAWLWMSGLWRSAMGSVRVRRASRTW